MAQNDSHDASWLKWGGRIVAALVVFGIIHMFKVGTPPAKPRPSPRAVDLSPSELETVIIKWDALSSSEQERLSPARNELIEYVVRRFLSTNRAEWLEMDIGAQTQACETVARSFEAIGYSRAEASGFSLFLGPFLESSPPQVTLKDAIIQYQAKLDQRRTEVGIAAVEKVLEFALTASQISQIMQQSQ
jgi:hypothetical protein